MFIMFIMVAGTATAAITVAVIAVAVVAPVCGCDGGGYSRVGCECDGHDGVYSCICGSYKMSVAALAVVVHPMACRLLPCAYLQLRPARGGVAVTALVVMATHVSVDCDGGDCDGSVLWSLAPTLVLL